MMHIFPGSLFETLLRPGHI